MSTLAVAFAFAAGSAGAQESDSDLFDGKWAVRLHGSGSGYQAANVVIADFAGTWQDIPARGAKVNPACRGKKFPITVQSSRTSELRFTVWGSALAPACPDLSLDLKPHGDKLLEGSIGPVGNGNGDGKVTLKRR